LKRARLPAGSRAAPARETLVVVAIVFGLALAVRIAAGIDAQDAPFWSTPTLDELNHLDLARRLVAGTPPPHGAFYIAPGYAYFLAVVMQAGGGVVAAKLLNLLAGAVGAALVAALAARFLGRWVGLVAGIAWSVYPSMLLHELLVLQPALTVLLVLATVLLVSAPTGSTRRWALAGVTLGPAILLRPELLIAALCLAASGVVARWRGWPAAPPPVAILVFAAGIAAAVAVPTLQNQVRSGDAVLVAYGGGTNFFIGNNENADGTYRALRPDRSDPAVEESDAMLLASTAVGRSLSPGEVSRYWRQQGLAWWRQHTVGALRLTGKKLALLWGTHEIADGLSTRLASRWVVGLRQRVVGPALVLPLALVGVWLARRRRELWPVFALWIGLQAAILPFFLFERFRLPLTAVNVLFAAFACTQAWSALRARRWRPLGLGCAAALGIAAALMQPRAGATELSLRAHVGALLASAGRYQEAIVEYEAVRAGMPDAWRIDINIATAQAQLGNMDAAAQAVERVLERLHAEERTTALPRTDDLAYCHELAAELARVRGDLVASAAHYQAAIRYATPADRPRLQQWYEAVSRASTAGKQPAP
jgi:hypothetical protein